MIGWADQALADGPRSIALKFFDRHDGIALGPHLAAWRHDLQASPAQGMQR
jgi:hypothetical protein